MLATSSLTPCPQDGFVALLPTIQRHAQIAFRHLRGDARQEAVSEATAAAFVAFVKLQRRGKDPARFPIRLALFAILHVRCHRRVGSRSAPKDVLCKKVQLRNGFQVKSLHDSLHDEWQEAVLDNTQTPVPDQASFRLAFPEFLASLSERDRRLACFLAQGHSAKEAATRFGISATRITQLRQRWCRDWRALHDELTPHEQCSDALLSQAG